MAGVSSFIMSGAVIFTFLLSLLGFIVIGVYAVKSKQGNTTEDYLLANRSVGPWFTALSAMASNNSGFMFVGFIGAVYAGGISVSWVMIGWIFGDYLTWFFIHEPLRERSAQQDAKTVPHSSEAPSTGASRAWRLPR